MIVLNGRARAPDSLRGAALALGVLDGVHRGHQAVLAAAAAHSAKLAAADGDPNARAEFEAILREYGDNPAFAHIIADVKARLGS